MPGQSCQMPRRSLDCCLICLLAMWCALAQLMTSERSLARFTDHLTMILRLLVTLRPVQLCYLPPLSTQDHGEKIAVFYYFNRDLQILKKLRLRERDFLNTQQFAVVNQRHFGAKTRQPIATSFSFYCEFQRECRSVGNKLSNVRSFTILRSAEGITSFN